MATTVALLDVPAQCCGTAALDGAHHPALAARERLGMSLPIFGPMVAKDIRHFEAKWHGAHGAPQKWGGGLGGGSVRSGCGSRSKGLAVAQTVLVATLR